MNWTTNKPTTEGWYWYRHSEDPLNDGCPVDSIFEVSKIYLKVYGDALFINIGCDGWVNIEKCTGEWSSEPIPRPEEIK